MKTLGQMAYDRAEAARGMAWWDGLSEAEKTAWTHAAATVSRPEIWAFYKQQTGFGKVPDTPRNSDV